MLRRLIIALGCIAAASAFTGIAAVSASAHTSHKRQARSHRSRRVRCRVSHKFVHVHGRRVERKIRRCHRAGKYLARDARRGNLAFPTRGNTWATPAAHTETWAYDDCANGGSNASASEVRNWVSYAEANCGPGGDQKTLNDCHSGTTSYCNVIQYLDTNWIYPNGSPTWKPFRQDASESWYQHTPGSQSKRILSTGYGGGYLINQNSGAVRSFFRNYARSNYNDTNGLMMDDQSSNLSTQLYYSSCGCSRSDEVGTTPGLRNAHTDMSAAMTHNDGQHFLQIDNTLPPNPYLPQGFDLLNRGDNVHGLISEGAPMSDGTLDPYYSTLLDQIAYVANKTDGFVVPLSYGNGGTSYEGRSRRVQEATILLGYSPGHLVDWADLEQNSNNLAVWPEEGIYPTRPLESMNTPGGGGCLAGTGQVCSSGGHNAIQVAPGVYRREFETCYDKGVAFGGCAAIVNTSGSPVTISGSWLRHSYQHVISFDGGDVQSGGTVDLSGGSFNAGSTTVGSHDAILLDS